MFHLYRGEATITLEDVHFLTNLTIDGELVELEMRLPNEAATLQAYVKILLGRKQEIVDLSTGRTKMTWLRSHFGTIRGDADDVTIELLRHLHLR
ncbi:Serine/threonine-protein phosphatase 7 long form homolog [Linum perenne]